MDQKTIGNWIMYHEIQRLLRAGYKISQIANYLVADSRTVKKYADMTESEYEAFLLKKTIRTKTLNSYEEFVKNRLLACPGASSAQILDWLKEHHRDFPAVSVKTVYNFVMGIRQKFGIPTESRSSRDYFIVEELPYGRQSQVDFGQYYLRSVNQVRKKVHFFSMMLARSRMKYVYFQDFPFTTEGSIRAHEAAWQYFGGITEESVYDQDRLFLVDENLGDYLLTREFRAYASSQRLKLVFCRKSDPESKGRVENVIKYIKQNFLYGRVYHDIETLQAEALQWLYRTANGMPHSTTKKMPIQEWEIEKKSLRPWVAVNISPSSATRNVRKDNVIAYQGSFYSVPQGTYNQTKVVRIYSEDGKINIIGPKGELICSHTLALSSGRTIINRDHKRDKHAKISLFITETAALFENTALATEYLELLRKEKGRYIRDHLQVIRDCIEGLDKVVVEQTLELCMNEKYLSANIFKEILILKQKKADIPDPILEKIILLNPNSTSKADMQPDKADLNDYEDIFKRL